MAGRYRLSWDSAPGPHLPTPRIVKPWSWNTVLFEDEVNLAMFVALESGLSVTALHNHFFFEHPDCSLCTSKVKARLSILPPPSGFSTTRSGSIAPLIQRRPILSSSPRRLTSAQ